MRFRKQEELLKGAETLRGDGYNGDVKVLTSCPSCLRGLSREGDTGMDADYIVVEMARHILGEGWMEDYVRRANAGRHRARAGVAVTRPPAGGYRCLANARRFRRAFSQRDASGGPTGLWLLCIKFESQFTF